PAGLAAGAARRRGGAGRRGALMPPLPDAVAAMRASVLHASWPAPPGVHALTTLRGPAGASAPPFDRLDLGLRNGDDAGVVRENRALLERGLALPSPPCWLRQVHGTGVVVDPDPAREPEADAAVAR